MSFSFVEDLACVSCGRRYALADDIHTCPDCGPLRGTLDVAYDLPSLKEQLTTDLLQARREPTLWRYHELLPISQADAIVPTATGMTPLCHLDIDVGFTLPRRVYAKDDTRMASGSSKDRATAVAVARARELGVTSVAAASTGNAASSLAMFAARAGLTCYIFVPANAPPAKLQQIQAHGAHLFMIEGTYDQAFDLCAQFCKATGCYSRNTATNPFLSEGKKTLALEIWEQLGFRAPEFVLVPVGDGCILGGVYKGFRDLLDLDLISHLPRLVGVQAYGSAALADAWQNEADTCTPVTAETVADSISVDEPRDQVKALRAIRETGGFFIKVRDEAILDAVSLLASRAGMLVEPAAATPFAGLRVGMASGLFRRESEVVLLHTGHGLKDMATVNIATQWNQPKRVAPDLQAVNAALQDTP